jgi:hypothetical protein
MFDCPQAVVFMSCGHSIHGACYTEHKKVSYKCPICNKSLLNMETQFRNLELAIQSQPMPPEFRDTKAVVLCNDCSAKSHVKYHWLGLKCAICSSYNTVELQILSEDTPVLPGVAVASGQANVPALVSENTAPIRSEVMRVPPSTRRRHSSHGLDMRNITNDLSLDRFARSVSPQHVPRMPSISSGMAGAHSDNSDDEIPDFWGRDQYRSGESDASDEDEIGEDSDSLPDDDDELDDDDDDDDDDDEILLIGHR